jgi:hypothetical protein
MNSGAEELELSLEFAIAAGAGERWQSKLIKKK